MRCSVAPEAGVLSQETTFAAGECGQYRESGLLQGFCEWEVWSTSSTFQKRVKPCNA